MERDTTPAWPLLLVVLLAAAGLGAFWIPGPVPRISRDWHVRREGDLSNAGGFRRPVKPAGSAEIHVS